MDKTMPDSALRGKMMNEKQLLDMYMRSIDAQLVLLEQLQEAMYHLACADKKLAERDE